MGVWECETNIYPKSANSQSPTVNRITVFSIPKCSAPAIRGSLFLIRRMTAKKPYSLGKSERLKSRKQIDALFEKGKKLSLFPFRLMYRAEPGMGEIKAGFTVSSKNFPRAVDRNRIKRLCREAYRLQKKELETGVLNNGNRVHLFFIYTGKEIAPYEEIAVRLKHVLDKLIKVFNEDHSSNS
jgi:ribonuclease P protein component